MIDQSHNNSQIMTICNNNAKKYKIEQIIHMPRIINNATQDCFAGAYYYREYTYVFVPGKNQ